VAENSKIEWTDHTFNPWEGCQKVGPGCDHCYAETRNARFGGGTAPNWGPGAPRRRTSEANWKKPGDWNKAHAEFFAQHGRRQRVFCASLADVFDNEVDPQWRADLFALINATPHLDWLLLTKRIGNVPAMVSIIPGWVPPNVWLGATVVNQTEADRDIPKLLAVPARVRFLSIEPMLGPISFEGLFASQRVNDGTNALEALSWVICGGESGPGARPMHPEWARSLRDQCAAAGVPFLFKQWGEWAQAEAIAEDDDRVLPERWLRRDGTEPPNDAIDFFGGDEAVYRAGKKAAGRLLDGVEHNGFPAS